MGNAIDICLATYNGGLYLQEQIDSIIKQTFTDWHLFIRDDGSTDNTLKILNENKKDHPDKITIVSDNKGKLGFIQNFNEIIKYTSAPIISFSDQDDIWEEDKLLEHFEVLKNLDNEGYLVQSNLIHINKFGKYVKKSLVDAKRVKSETLNKNIIRGLYWGYAVGCAVSINRKLLIMCGEVPQLFPTGHDIWYLCGAILLGKIKFINKVHVMHRIHANNTSNSNKGSKVQFNVKNVLKAQKMASCLLNRHRNTLSNYNKNLLEQQIQFDRFSLLNRINFYIISGIFTFSCFKRSIILFFKFLLYPHFQHQ